MQKTRTLYLFTATFPYGDKEPFLETEISYLCSAFTNVVIVPLSGRLSSRRSVPTNCSVLFPIIRNRYLQYLHIFTVAGFKIFIQDFFIHKVWKSKQRLKTWFIAYVLFNNYICSKQIKKIIREIAEDDIIYSYWGKGACYLAPYIKKKIKFVSRFHGEWDLWEESSGNYAPIRKLVAGSLSLAVFISQKGENYFKKRYQCPTIVSRLGIINIDTISKKSDDGILRLVSCSSVYSLKRVPLIFQALQLIDNIQVQWTHIGDGAEFKSLKQLVEDAHSNIHVKLLGKLTNKDVMTYYATNAVDVFINVSTNEGIPVSIMEAISFDIPAIATDVGGTSEIVNNETGILLPPNPTLYEIKEALLKIRRLSFSPRTFWMNHYNADVNYKLFAKQLSEL